MWHTYENLISHGHEDDSCSLPGCNTMWACRWLPLFQRNLSVMVEAVHSSKMFVTTCKTTWCDNPENHVWHIHPSQVIFSEFIITFFKIAHSHFCAVVVIFNDYNWLSVFCIMWSLATNWMQKVQSTFEVGLDWEHIVMPLLKWVKWPQTKILSYEYWNWLLQCC
jgi:hypothetical protein